MIELHGISVATMHMGGVDWLKREILLYDKIGLVHLESCKHILRDYSSVKARRADTYEYMQNAGVIYEPKIPADSKIDDVRFFLKKVSEASDKFEYEHPSTTEKWMEREMSGRRPAPNSYEHLIDKDAYIARAVAIETSHKNAQVATPIIDPASYIEDSGLLKKVPVYQAVIHEFPVPSDTVPFEDLLMLRAEREFIEKRDALRSWIRRVSAEEWSKAEILDEIRHLLHQYQEYMRIQKIKYERSSLSGIAKFSAGLLEDAAKLKLKDFTESVCSIFTDNINMVEAELSAPGRELAYIAGLNSRLRA